jgi:hypothetical protein
VEVRFADGSSRRFVASYVQPVARQPASKEDSAERDSGIGA